MWNWTILVAGIAVCSSSTLLGAELTLARLFNNHAVLQRDQPLPVWGWANPGEKIRVELGDQSAETVTDPQGKWLVQLGPQPVKKTPLSLRVTGSKTIELQDILLGDVWLCSGQSNMEFPLGACDAATDIQAADFPLIRHFGVD